MRTECGGQICLPCSGWTDAEHQRMRSHEIEIRALRRRSRAHGAPRSRLHGRNAKISIRLWLFVAGEGDFGIHFPRPDILASFEPRVQRSQYGGSTLARLGRSFQRHEVAPRGHSHAKLLLKPDKILLVRTAECGEKRIIGEFEGHLLVRQLAPLCLRRTQCTATAFGRAPANAPLRLFVSARRITTSQIVPTRCSASSTCTGWR